MGWLGEYGAQWTRQVLAAEAVRRGAVPVLSDPLALLFAPVRDAIWTTAEGAMASQSPDRPHLLIAEPGQDTTLVSRLMPELIIGAPADPFSDGYDGRDVGQSRLFWMTDGPARRFADDLCEFWASTERGEPDLFDWILEQIPHGSPAMDCRFNADGGAEVVLDARTCVRGLADRDVGLLTGRPGVPLFRERPVRLRLPLLLQGMTIDIHSVGRPPCAPVRWDDPGEGVSVETHRTADGGTTRLRVTVDRPAIPWTDLTLRGHRQQIETVGLHIPPPHRESVGGFDPLDVYGVYDPG